MPMLYLTFPMRVYNLERIRTNYILNLTGTIKGAVNYSASIEEIKINLNYLEEIDKKATHSCFS